MSCFNLLHLCTNYSILDFFYISKDRRSLHGIALALILYPGHLFILGGLLTPCTVLVTRQLQQIGRYANWFLGVGFEPMRTPLELKSDNPGIPQPRITLKKLMRHWYSFTIVYLNVSRWRYFRCLTLGNERYSDIKCIIGLRKRTSCCTLINIVRNKGSFILFLAVDLVFFSRIFSLSYSLVSRFHLALQ